MGRDFLFATALVGIAAVIAVMLIRWLKTRDVFENDRMRKLRKSRMAAKRLMEGCSNFFGDSYHELTLTEQRLVWVFLDEAYKCLASERQSFRERITADDPAKI
jgi:hypothetical protein